MLCGVSKDLSGNYGFLKFIFFLLLVLCCCLSLFNSVAGIVIMHVKHSKELTFSRSLLLSGGSVFTLA